MAVITISRQFASSGDEVAARVCQLMGYRYFDKALMARIAAEMGIGEHEIVDYSEDEHRVRGILDRLFNGPLVVTESRRQTEDASGQPVNEIKKLDEKELAGLVRSAVEAAYRLGDVVIVGRGGQAILQQMPDVLHVRIETPLVIRIERAHDQNQLTYGEAANLISERDRATADYLKRFYDVDWSDSSLYHMVLNLGRLSVDGAAHIIVDAVRYLS